MNVGRQMQYNMSIYIYFFAQFAEKTGDGMFLTDVT